MQTSVDLNRKIILFPTQATKPTAKPQTQFKVGQKVSHSIFGKGIVIHSQFMDGDEEVTIAFSDKKAGLKKLFASIANLSLIES